MIKRLKNSFLVVAFVAGAVLSFLGSIGGFIAAVAFFASEHYELLPLAAIIFFPSVVIWGAYNEWKL